MSENNQKKSVVRVTENHANKEGALFQEPKHKIEKFKKPLLFSLMFLVFLGCMYLIFKPTTDDTKKELIGLNPVVPQATNIGMPTDKGKAYEEELLSQKSVEKNNAFTTLADYWHFEDQQETIPLFTQSNKKDSPLESDTQQNKNPALDSYRNAQSTLDSFYKNDDTETQKLRREIEDLKNQLNEQEVPKTVTIDDQLTLMEKSYQMAAKYLPQNNQTQPSSSETKETIPSNTSAPIIRNQKENLVAITSAKKQTVSALYREPSDSAFISDWNQIKNRHFYGIDDSLKSVQPKNSINACIHVTQTVIDHSSVQLRLLEDAQIASHIIPKGSLLTAITKFQEGRLQLKVNTFEINGTIIPVELTIYDLDGQAGLLIPFSLERNAATDIIANMGNVTGSSFSMSSSTGQQLTSDLSKSALQGISGYFAKKVRTPKITLKAGHQVFLVSKK
ncbi:conjugative transposon protein TraM [Flavobacterium sp. xlx-214]|uniref:conjugative transposon protein TraM n=1 Tax=unclassified Flavobacterium TaxID=196869 RepID=UPI0013D86912|nr:MULTISPECIES: conjugative transposon protein TraM [unclassified Flavobacterium]MBA5793478.1 conjugative transposon protein TraM [Flavobacterium sp. xlx-221]QMI82751.1 conjugative transposon protein TraM [Flavobacterium sp. xlx-214]